MDLWISFGLFRSDFLNVLKQISFQKNIFLAFDDFSSFRVRGKDKKTRALRGKYQTRTFWDVGALCHTHNCCLFAFRFFCSKGIHKLSNGTAIFTGFFVFCAICVSYSGLQCITTIVTVWHYSFGPSANQISGCHRGSGIWLSKDLH